jgi:hypothetical protein
MYRESWSYGNGLPLGLAKEKAAKSSISEWPRFQVAEQLHLKSKVASPNELPGTGGSPMTQVACHEITNAYGLQNI